MSLTTLLLALVPTVFQPKRAAAPKTAAELIFDNADLRAERDALQAELERVLRRNEELVLERDSARRRVDELQRLLNRAPPLDVQRANEMLNRIVAEQVAQQQGLQNALAAAQVYGTAVQAMNVEWRDCTCVPARHDMLLGALGQIL